MEDIFISKIHINKVRHLENVDIVLSETERKHLILTGRNGSGKTSVLEVLRDIFLIDFYHYKSKEVGLYKEDNSHLRHLKFTNLPTNNQIELFYNSPQTIFNSFKNGNLIFSFHEAKRNLEIDRVTGIFKVSLPENPFTSTNVRSLFLQYIVNLKATRSFSRDSNNLKKIKSIDDWFDKFENALRIIFNDENLKLIFDDDEFNFQILFSNNTVSDFHNLPDGFSSVISIVTELIMRMESNASGIYDLQGIVLIDEIETHLHIDLQKKILPFLTSFFPKIQFIVTTHSPFVLSSIKNAVIFDLEKKEGVEDLSGYSLDAIVKGYFDNNTYSKTLIDEIKEYETLLNNDFLTIEQKARKHQLQAEFEKLPTFLAPEIQLKLNQLKLAELELIND